MGLSFRSVGRCISFHPSLRSSSSSSSSSSSFRLPYLCSQRSRSNQNDTMMTTTPIIPNRQQKSFGLSCCSSSSSHDSETTKRTTLSLAASRPVGNKQQSQDPVTKQFPTPSPPPPHRSHKYRVFLGVGSNQGNKYQNIQQGLQLLCQGTNEGSAAGVTPPENDSHSSGSSSRPDAAMMANGLVVQLQRTSFLYETAPMYVTQQPSFLNGAVEVTTDLPPNELLSRIKRVEEQLGRNLTRSAEFRNGPRPLDLDILFYEEKDEDEDEVKEDYLSDDSKETTLTTTTADMSVRTEPVDPNGTAGGHETDNDPQRLRRQQQRRRPVLWNDDNLTIPHPAMAERDFVLTPLMDVATGKYRHPRLNQTLQQLQTQLAQQQQNQQQQQSTKQKNDISKTKEEPPKEEPSLARVIPLPRNRLLRWENSHHPYPSASSPSVSCVLLMGILNVTPDSFSDGGQWWRHREPEDSQLQWATAVNHALQMEREGASVIDIGGESTRPGAPPVVTIQEELDRTIPVIRELRKVSDICISIDTRNAQVAEAAIAAGADLVNDVSGGCHDAQMLSTVARMKVPMILMHMRGTPQTMASLTNYDDDDIDTDTDAGGNTNGGVVAHVAQALADRVRAAEAAGIPRWMLMVDPGIGFAKDGTGNLRLLRNMKHLRSTVDNLPVLLGTSRKGFLGKIAEIEEPQHRDYATIASLITPACLELTTTTEQQQQQQDTTTKTFSSSACTIWRVHNVAAANQALKVMNAIQQQQ